MTRRTPVQKLARQIQAATGKPYTACLTEAKVQICTEQFPGPGPNNSEEDACSASTAPPTP